MLNSRGTVEGVRTTQSIVGKSKGDSVPLRISKNLQHSLIFQNYKENFTSITSFRQEINYFDFMWKIKNYTRSESKAKDAMDM